MWLVGPLASEQGNDHVDGAAREQGLRHPNFSWEESSGWAHEWPAGGTLHGLKTSGGSQGQQGHHSMTKARLTGDHWRREADPGNTVSMSQWVRSARGSTACQRPPCTQRMALW